MQLVKYIKELLYRHDLVIIPELGAFVVKPVSSKIDAANHIITPPGKVISFNSQIKDNDGLLAHYIAIQDKIPYESAMNFIQMEVENFKKELAAEDQRWEEIGTFSLEENRIVFTPDPSANFDVSAFGLSPLSASAKDRDEGDLDKLKIDEIFDEILNDEEDGNMLTLTDAGEDDNGSSYGFVKYVAGLLLLFGLGYVGYLLYQNKFSSHVEPVQKASFDIPGELRTIDVFVGKSEGDNTENAVQDTGDTDEAADSNAGELADNDTVQEESTGDTESYQEDTVQQTETTADVAESNDTGTSQNEMETPVENTVETTASEENYSSGTSNTHAGRYHIIAGAFKFPENANKKVNQLKAAGYDAYIVGVNKWQLTQVSLGNYDTKEEAQEALRQVRNSGAENGAWILVK